jgi:hypothetical protein
MTEPTQAVVEDMSRSNALDLLQWHGFVGPVAFIVDGRPMIMPVKSWAVRPTAHWIRVTYEQVSGRCIPAH